MASSSTRRMSWRALAPIVAIAAVGLSACSNSEEPSDTPRHHPAGVDGFPRPGRCRRGPRRRRRPGRGHGGRIG